MTPAFPTLSPYERIGSRRFRRGLVIGTYGGWLVAAAIARLLTPAGANWPVIPFIPLSLVLVVLTWFARKTYISREVLAGDSGLDERLIQNRNHAFRRAFQVFVPVVLISWLVSMVVTWLQPGMDALTNAILIYTGVVLLGTTLPTVIWAWREPDPLTTTDELP